jgi:hypothetical protein
VPYRHGRLQIMLYCHSQMLISTTTLPDLEWSIPVTYNSTLFPGSPLCHEREGDSWKTELVTMIVQRRGKENLKYAWKTLVAKGRTIQWGERTTTLLTWFLIQAPEVYLTISHEVITSLWSLNIRWNYCRLVIKAIKSIGKNCECTGNMLASSISWEQYFGNKRAQYKIKWFKMYITLNMTKDYK